MLEEVFKKGFFADRVLEYHFKKNPKWGARDRRFVAESFYDLVRWWRRLWFAVDSEPSFDEDAILKILTVWFRLQKDTDVGGGRIDWPSIERRWNDGTRAIKNSVPDWIDELGAKALGVEWEENLRVLNQPAQVILRANRLKSTPEKLCENLRRESIEARLLDGYPDAVILDERRNVFKTESFRNGFFEVQDASSQKVALFLDPKPGERVIDACAGAGGKSLHLASLMKNKGRIISMDIEQRKLDELRKRASRNGVDIVETRLIEDQKTIKRLAESADRVLLDVPCSGTGVWRRNPDSRWKLKPERLIELCRLQAQILRDYSRMLKPNGTLVYATCSILPVENKEVVGTFLKENEAWQLESECICRPHVDGFDGFYMARLRRS